MADLIVDLDTLQRLTTYSGRMRRSIIDVVGGGKDGSVYKSSGRSVVKLLNNDEIYLKELAAYQVLREHRVVAINQFQVPRLVSFHDDLRAIEMTIVEPPTSSTSRPRSSTRTGARTINCRSNFTSASSSSSTTAPPMFWLRSNASRTLHGIHLLDAHPANITF